MYNIQNFFSSPLSFEADLVKLAEQINNLKSSCKDDGKILKTISGLEKELISKIEAMYTSLTPIQKVEIARSPARPHGIDYIKQLCQDFFEITGDRTFGEDRAIIAGLANFHNMPTVVIAHEKGKDGETRKIHNFGMASPEGYKKAIRALKLAEQLSLPVVCFVDTPGAYPGISSEERGQGYVLAECIAVSAEVKVPIISCLIGEGGSGGAVAISVANKVLMLEHSVYSVISPEGCASILWKTKDNKAEAAVAQKLTAQDLQKYGLIDEIVPEPFGGAHRNPIAAINMAGEAIANALRAYSNKSHYSIYLDERKQKYLNHTILP
jgi:acetyl-CoA carboxylase carboxyl transferase subunit alpha